MDEGVFGRTCNVCKQFFPADRFSPNKGGVNGLNSRCKECINKNYASPKEVARRKTDSYKEVKRRHYHKVKGTKLSYKNNKHTRRLFGKEAKEITEFVDNHLNINGTKCEVCGILCAFYGESSSINKPKLVLDHCHKTGKLRGMLCSLCNMALGSAKDDIVVLESLINYLKKHQ